MPDSASSEQSTVIDRLNDRLSSRSGTGHIYRYSSCCCSYSSCFFGGGGRSSSKSAQGFIVSNGIGMKFVRIVLQVNTHRVSRIFDMKAAPRPSWLLADFSLVLLLLL